MPNRREFLLGASCLGLLTSVPALASPTRAVRDQLWSRLARKVEKGEFVHAVSAQAGEFPEGDLFPYSLPVLASVFGNGGSLDLAEFLCSQVLRAATARLGGRSVLALQSYEGEGTYLGQALACLGALRLVGSSRFEAEYSHLARILRKELDGRALPLESRPDLVWPFDTVPALLGFWPMAIQDEETRVWLFAQLHELSSLAIHSSTGLPSSAVDKESGEAVGLPRGCDLSLRIALLAAIEPSKAVEIYKTYKASFWQDSGMYAGFREWPQGVVGPQGRDSGLIVGGVGMSATVLGIAAARSVGDHEVVNALESQTLRVLSSLPVLQAQFDPSGLLPFDQSTWVTGSAVGDATLLFALSWTGIQRAEL